MVTAPSNCINTSLSDAARGSFLAWLRLGGMTGLDTVLTSLMDVAEAAGMDVQVRPTGCCCCTDWAAGAALTVTATLLAGLAGEAAA